MKQCVHSSGFPRSHHLCVEPSLFDWVEPSTIWLNGTNICLSGTTDCLTEWGHRLFDWVEPSAAWLCGAIDWLSGAYLDHMSQRFQWPPVARHRTESVARTKACEELHSAASLLAAAEKANPFREDYSICEDVTTTADDTGKAQSKAGYSRMWEDPLGDRHSIPLYNRLNFSTVPRKATNKKAWWESLCFIKVGWKSLITGST